MRKRFAEIICVALAAISLGSAGFGQMLSELSLPPNGANQRAEVSQWIGLVKVTIAYHGPNVHGGGGADRTGHIWGELVPYGLFDDGHGPSKATPWRVGANETTTISFSHDVQVEGKEIKAGTYGLFLELDKDGPWTWVFSRDATGWGSYQYDPKDDVLRVTAVPADAAYTEFMTFGFDDRRPDSAVAYLQWELKRISFKINVPNSNELYVEAIRRDLQGWPGFNYQNWQQAAQFCANRKINLEEALVWADRAIHEPFRGVARGGRVEFGTLRTKASVLEAMGRTDEADALTEQALGLPNKDLLAVYFYGSGLLNAGKKDKALRVFKINAAEHPEEKFWTYLGLAQAFTATGDKSNAIQNWEKVLQAVPDGNRAEIPDYQKTLRGLREGS